MLFNTNTSFLLRRDKKAATAEEFLIAYQKCWPKAIYPKDLEFQDFMEFAEDYADYVCAYEKMFSIKGLINHWVMRYKIAIFLKSKGRICLYLLQKV